MIENLSRKDIRNACKSKKRYVTMSVLLYECKEKSMPMKVNTYPGTGGISKIDNFKVQSPSFPNL